MGNQALNVAKFAVGGRQLVALPHRRRRQGARPPRQPHQPRRARHVRRRVHDVDRPRAAGARRLPDRARHARRPRTAGPARGVRGRRARDRVRRLPRADRLGEGGRPVAARRRDEHAGGLPRPGRDRRPRHPPDRPRRPGRLPELAPRRVRRSRRAPGAAVRAEPPARADLHEGRGRGGPGHGRPRSAEEDRLRHHRGSGRRPLSLPAGQVGQPDRRGCARGHRGRLHRALPARCRRCSCWSRCS